MRAARVHARLLRQVRALPGRARAVAAFSRYVAVRFAADRGTQLAASLTYGTLLALVPFVTVAVMIASTFPEVRAYLDEVHTFLLEHMLPETTGQIVTNYMGRFSQQAAGLTVLGTVSLLVTALLLMYTINTAFNDIWRVRRARPLGKRLAVYVVVLTFGPVLMGASLSLTSYFTSQTVGITRVIPGAELALLAAVPFFFTVMSFFLLYLVVPNRRVAVRDALVGALVAAVAFEAMKRGFALYVVLFPTYELIYGAFAAFPVFLLWLYLSWVVVVAGAEIAAGLRFWRRGERAGGYAPRVQLVHAMRILGALEAAAADRGTSTSHQLARELGIPPGQIEEILDRLYAAGMVQFRAGSRYAPARAAMPPSVWELYRVFVLRRRGPERTAAGEGDGALLEALDRLERHAATVLSEPVDAFVGAAGDDASRRVVPARRTRRRDAPD